jgi:PIN domain nuclease of toxin-antitoxin system
VFVQESIVDNGFAILSIEPRHTAELVSLPYHHRDPFDRLLIAQAIVEGMPIISGDPALDAYPIRRVW